MVFTLYFRLFCFILAPLWFSNFLRVRFKGYLESSFAEFETFDCVSPPLSRSKSFYTAWLSNLDAVTVLLDTEAVSDSSSTYFSTATADLVRINFFASYRETRLEIACL